MDTCTTAIYRPRRPETTDLYRAVAENLQLFYETYDERFLAQHGPLTATADDVRDIDLLIAPHHGWRSGRNYQFLDVLNPRLTFFGKDSDFLFAARGHRCQIRC